MSIMSIPEPVQLWALFRQRREAMGLRYFGTTSRRCLHLLVHRNTASEAAELRLGVSSASTSWRMVISQVMLVNCARLVAGARHPTKCCRASCGCDVSSAKFYKAALVKASHLCTDGLSVAMKTAVSAVELAWYLGHSHLRKHSAVLFARCGHAHQSVSATDKAAKTDAQE